jgi:hypothetical protein
MLVTGEDVSRWQRARYRVEQFLRGWRARLADEDRRLIIGVLAPAALALFERMPADAQVHSVRVLHTLQESGPTPADLAVAALLHDAGKVAATDAGAYLGLWMRGPVVLLEAFAPALLQRLAAPRPSPSPRYAIHVQLAHSQIGAAWARAAGCSELTCWLIEHHQNRMKGARGEGRGATPLTASSDSKMAARECDDAPCNSQLAPDLLSRLQWADGRN